MSEPARAPDGEAMSMWDQAAKQAIDACDGDAKDAVVALVILNNALEHELRLTRMAVSSGFSRQWHLKRSRNDDGQAQ
jgi:hypothetical protein